MKLLDFLLDKHGVTMTLEQVAKLLHIAPGTLRNQRAAGKCVIPFYQEGKKLLVDVRWVAEHLEHRASSALAMAEDGCTSSASSSQRAA